MSGEGTPYGLGAVLAGRFELTGAALGEGSVGTIYPGIDREAETEVAIKLVHPHLVNEPHALVQLRADAGAASRIQHPNVLRVHGLWSEGGRWFLVTDRVHGASVASLEARCSVDAVLAMGVQLSDALAAIHRTGLVHGDVRPGSVLIGQNGAMLFDFGRSAPRPGETAPEVHAGGPPCAAADLYGLGVVLHRALTGRPAFEGANPWAVIGAQREARVVVSDAPAGVERLLQHLLHPDPTRRPVDAAAVRQALRALQLDPSRVVSPTRTWIAPIRPRRNWVVQGIDPATGAPALVRQGLSRGAAKALAERLRDDGWKVSAERVALGARDLVAIAVLAILFGLILPVFGHVIGVGLGLVALSTRCRPVILRALPPVKAAVPFTSAPGDGLALVAVGLLMFATAAWMILFPPVGALVALALVAVVWQRSSQPGAIDGASAAELVHRCDEVAQRERPSTLARDGGRGPAAALRAARAEVAGKQAPD